MKGKITVKKRSFLLLLLACALLLLTSCGSDHSVSTQKSSEIPVVLSQPEYVLSQNIFFNNYMDDYVGKETEKEGVFAVIQDAFSKVTRYYVWGCLDQTLCCDWQWEFVPEEPDKLPPPGSKIKVSGTYEKTDSALDDLWIVKAKVETLVEYTGEQAELNMRTMSDTLERVQLSNMVRRAEQFIGKDYIAYGRIATGSMLQDPYYDGSWSIPYESSETMPAIGTIAVIRGVYQDQVLSEAKLVTTMK